MRLRMPRRHTTDAWLASVTTWSVWIALEVAATVTRYRGLAPWKGVLFTLFMVGMLVDAVRKVRRQYDALLGIDEGEREEREYARAFRRPVGKDAPRVCIGGKHGDEIQIFRAEVSPYPAVRTSPEGALGLARLIEGAVGHVVDHDEQDKNTRVTFAIHRAEDLTRRALLAWARVREAERAIADDASMPETDRAIARRGVDSAVETIRTIQQVDRYSDELVAGRREESP